MYHGYEPFVNEQPELIDTITQLDELATAMQAGDLSVEEYQELVQDLTDLSVIDELSASIERKAELERILTLLRGLAASLPLT